MIKTRMLDPVAWLRTDELRKLGEPYSDSPINQRTDSMLLHAKGTVGAAKRYGFDVPVITTDQAEAYADARVREALEEAAQTCEARIGTGDAGIDTSDCDEEAQECAAAIRALLIPNTK